MPPSCRTIRYSRSYVPSTCLGKAAITASRSSGCMASMKDIGSSSTLWQLRPQIRSYAELMNSMLFLCGSVIQNTSSIVSVTWRWRSSLSRRRSSSSSIRAWSWSTSPLMGPLQPSLKKGSGREGLRSLAAAPAPVTGRPAGSSRPICTSTLAWSHMMCS